MTVRKAGKGIVRSGGGTYQIGYTDLYGMEQETELSAFGMKDLEELWSSLCSGNLNAEKTVSAI